MRGGSLLTRTSFLGVLVVALGFMVGAISQPEAATAQSCPYTECFITPEDKYECWATTNPWECDLLTEEVCDTEECEQAGDDPCCPDPE